jgi:hypothetical protein
MMGLSIETLGWVALVFIAPGLVVWWAVAVALRACQLAYGRGRADGARQVADDVALYAGGMKARLAEKKYESANALGLVDVVTTAVEGAVLSARLVERRLSREGL